MADRLNDFPSWQFVLKTTALVVLEAVVWTVVGTGARWLLLLTALFALLTFIVLILEPSLRRLSNKLFYALLCAAALPFFVFVGFAFATYSGVSNISLGGTGGRYFGGGGGGAGAPGGAGGTYVAPPQSLPPLPKGGGGNGGHSGLFRDPKTGRLLVCGGGGGGGGAGPRGGGLGGGVSPFCIDWNTGDLVNPQTGEVARWNTPPKAR